MLRSTFPGPRPSFLLALLLLAGTASAVARQKADSGETVWTKSYAKDFGGTMMSGWGYSESPLVDGDRLICTPGAKDAMLAALDKRSGKTIWKTDTGSADLGDKGSKELQNHHGGMILADGKSTSATATTTAFPSALISKPATSCGTNRAARAAGQQRLPMPMAICIFATKTTSWL